jgi:hypothetical protein
VSPYRGETRRLISLVDAALWLCSLRGAFVSDMSALPPGLHQNRLKITADLGGLRIVAPAAGAIPNSHRARCGRPLRRTRSRPARTLAVTPHPAGQEPATHVTAGTGRTQTRSYVSGISQTSSTSSLTTCDLVSQQLSPAAPGTATGSVCRASASTNVRVLRRDRLGGLIREYSQVA